MTLAVNGIPDTLNGILIDDINAIIRSEAAQDDDVFQCVWLEILESGITNKSDIRRLASKVAKKYFGEKIGESFKLRSLQKPLSTESESFTLEDTLATPEIRANEEIEHDIDVDESYVATSTGKINQTGNVHLDYDTWQRIKSLYPHDPLNHAIRKLTGLSPAKRDKRGWHRWEDAIVRERYPWGGSLAVSLDVHRSQNAIEKRARYLKIYRGHRTHKPVAEWMTTPEIAEICRAQYNTVTSWFKKGYIKTIRISKYYHGHDGVFVTPDAFQSFLENYYYVYDPKKLAKAYQKFVPDNPQWISTKEAAKLCGVSRSTIQYHVRNKHIKSIAGYGRSRYVNPWIIPRIIYKTKVVRRKKIVVQKKVPCGVKTILSNIATKNYRKKQCSEKHKEHLNFWTIAFARKVENIL